MNLLVLMLPNDCNDVNIRVFVFSRSVRSGF